MEKYLTDFQEKHGTLVQGFVFQFSDIKIDIDNEIPVGVIENWHQAGKKEDYSIYLIHNYYAPNELVVVDEIEYEKLL